MDAFVWIAFCSNVRNNGLLGGTETPMTRTRKGGTLKLWGGRFRKPTSEALNRLGRSVDFDRRLASEEIHVNRAYARALARAGWLTDEELHSIDRGL